MQDKLWDVDIDITKKIRQIKKKLNYELEFSDDRVKLVNEILAENHWLVDYMNSQGFINKQVKTKNHSLSEKDMFCTFVQLLADYLLFTKYENKKDKSLCEDLTKSGDKGKILNEEEQRIRKRYLKPKDQITEKDLFDFQELRQNQYTIKYLEKMLGYNDKNITKELRMELHNKIKKNSGTHYLKFLRETYSDIKKESITMKEKLRGTFEFKQITKGTTIYSFEEDTGYFDENDNYIEINQGKIDFRNKRHISGVIKYYNELEQKYGEDFNSDMWGILFDINDMIKQIDIEDYVREILRLHFMGFKGNQICEEVNNNFNVNITNDNVSKFIKQVVNKIHEKYLYIYEEWFYTYRVKGEYKMCNSCKENKLATEKYFFKREDSIDGFRHVCKKCLSE